MPKQFDNPSTNLLSLNQRIETAQHPNSSKRLCQPIQVPMLSDFFHQPFPNLRSHTIVQHTRTTTYSSTLPEIFSHAKRVWIPPQTVMPGFRGGLATFSRTFFLFFFYSTSRQPLTVCPAQLLDLCHNLRKVVVQIF